MKGMQLTIIDLLHSTWKRNSRDFDSRLDGGISFNKDWLRSGLHGMVLKIKTKRLLNDDRQSWYISYIWSLLGDALTKTRRKFQRRFNRPNTPAVGKGCENFYASAASRQRRLMRHCTDLLGRRRR
jgi:hypothetical protein